MKRKTIESGISPPYILFNGFVFMHGHMLLSSQPLNALKDSSSMGLRSRKVRTCKCILWVQILYTGFLAAITCKGHFTSNNSSVLSQNFQLNERLVLDSFLSIISTPKLLFFEGKTFVVHPFAQRWRYQNLAYLELVSAFMHRG